MRQLLDDAQAIALIDELFFEYHVHDKYMYPIWRSGEGNNNIIEGDMEDAYKLFAALRKKGLRVHSWV
jgi:hypothetical protein